MVKVMTFLASKRGLVGVVLAVAAAVAAGMGHWFGFSGGGW